MECYPPLKLLHILSSTLLFGTGLGTAYYMWKADQHGDVKVTIATAKHVVVADWIFTTPAIILQPATGLTILHLAGIPMSTTWVLWSMGLYVFVGLCWLPVVWLQHKIAKLQHGKFDHKLYKLYIRWWYSLGWPAFVAVIIIFYLMVFKPG